MGSTIVPSRKDDMSELDGTPIEDGAGAALPTAESVETPTSDPAATLPSDTGGVQGFDWSTVPFDEMPEDVRESLAPKVAPWYGQRLGQMKEKVANEYEQKFNEFTSRFQAPQAPATDDYGNALCELPTGERLPIDEDGLVEYQGVRVPPARAQFEAGLVARINGYEQEKSQAQEQQFVTSVETVVSDAFMKTFPADLQPMAKERAELSTLLVRNAIAGFKAQHGDNPPQELIDAYAKELAQNDLRLAGRLVVSQQQVNQNALQNGVIPAGGTPAVPGQKTSEQIFAGGNQEEIDAFLTQIGTEAMNKNR